jgi:hypothetical protein
MSTEVVTQSASDNDLRICAHTKTSDWEYQSWTKLTVRIVLRIIWLHQKVVDRATKQNIIIFLSYINLIYMINFMCAKSACLP